MSVLLKDRIIKELEAVQYVQEDFEANADAGLEAVMNGLYDYLNEDYSFTGITVGTHNKPPNPDPLIGVTTVHSVILGSKDSYLSTFKTLVKNGLPNGGIQRIFQAIALMLTGTVQASFKSLPTSFVSVIPGLDIPMVPILFPSMASFGTPAELEVMGSKPPDKEKYWDLIAKYIQQGLNVNVVPPIPTNGVIVSPATGITTGVLVYN